jgi:hypothetical protein
MEKPLLLQQLRLYDQRLFTLLMGLRRSPLLGLLKSDTFNLILKHCEKWQTCTQVKWTKQDALKKWLQFENQSLLIMGIKKYIIGKKPSLEQKVVVSAAAVVVWRPPTTQKKWQMVYTPRKIDFELRLDEQQLVASGQLHWCSSIMFATPIYDETGTRAYFRLHMGPMGSRPTPEQPIRAHAGLVAPCKKKGSGYYDWMPTTERAISMDEISNDEWCTVLLMQAFCLRVRWV